MYFDKNYILINIGKIKQKNLLNISNTKKQKTRLKIISKRGSFNQLTTSLSTTCRRLVNKLGQAIQTRPGIGLMTAR